MNTQYTTHPQFTEIIDFKEFVELLKTKLWRIFNLNNYAFIVIDDKSLPFHNYNRFNWENHMVGREMKWNGTENNILK